MSLTKEILLKPRPLYIFDLDGTLALIDHRRKFLDDKNDPHRWDKFFETCDQDEPNWPVINTMEKLKAAGCAIYIFSGRLDTVRDKTITWLKKYTSFTDIELTLFLKMRPNKDSRPDDILKQEWLDNMLDIDRARIVAVFDDRDKVVAMWRRNNISCFQVAEGNF